MASQGEVVPGVGYQVAHGAGVLRGHVGQERDRIGGLVRVDLGKGDAAEDARRPIGARIILRLSLWAENILAAANSV